MAVSSSGSIPTGLGTFVAHFGETGLERLLLPPQRPELVPKLQPEDRADDRMALLADELRAYSEGRLTVFSTPLSLRGTEFQLRVWKAVSAVGYGSIATYGEIARQVGGSARAVGAANGANPVPVIVPCHRIIGSDGSLTGYGGGLPLKRRLLELEGFLLNLR